MSSSLAAPTSLRYFVTTPGTASTEGYKKLINIELRNKRLFGEVCERSQTPSLDGQTKGFIKNGNYILTESLNLIILWYGLIQILNLKKQIATHNKSLE